MVHFPCIVHYSCGDFKIYLAATRSFVVPGPDPVPEGSIALLLSVQGPLFFPGTEDEEELIQGNLVGEG